ncbi:MAG TPA: hypothetical protein VMW33_01860 [Ilumatobacteraceae bacterium]|nr:hypothetical protein [Ilumatobacteraceae bacterium]
MAHLLIAGGLLLGLVANVPSTGATGSMLDASDAALELNGRASASAPAVRGQQVQLKPLPPLPSCQRVAVIGDSLMDNARWYLARSLDQAGYTNIIDAQPSRRIPESVRAPYSGVTAAREVRSSWGEADCWVVALGSNDLIFDGGDPIVAASMIDSMLAVVTPNSRVWWVNVDYHRDPRIAFDFVGASMRFNAALDARATVDPNLTVIDWYSLAEQHLDWFFDPVHVNATGSRARAEQVVEALAS